MIPVRLKAFVGCSCLLLLAACSRNDVRLLVPSAVTSSDNSFTDLQPGGTLQVVVPLLKSGKFLPDLIPQKVEGNTITYAASDLIGYTTSEYAVRGKRSSAVHLSFESARMSVNGKANPAGQRPPLPFELPRKAGHIRLVYLVRSSHADHNMAIVASKHLDTLNEFTAQLKQNPDLCTVHDGIFCSWVPAGIAVRPRE